MSAGFTIDGTETALTIDGSTTAAQAAAEFVAEAQANSVLNAARGYGLLTEIVSLIPLETLRIILYQPELSLRQVRMGLYL